MYWSKICLPEKCPSKIWLSKIISTSKKRRAPIVIKSSDDVMKSIDDVMKSIDDVIKSIDDIIVSTEDVIKSIDDVIISTNDVIKSVTNFRLKNVESLNRLGFCCKYLFTLN